MKQIFFSFLMIIITESAFATVFTGKVKVMRGPDSRPCLLVTMKDVTSVEGGGPWFAIELSRSSFDLTSSMLLSAKMADRTVKIHTTGGGVAECSNLPKISLVEIM